MRQKTADLSLHILRLYTVVFGKVLDNAVVGEESCLFETIHSFIDLKVYYVFGDVLVEMKLEHSFIRNLFACYT